MSWEWKLALVIVAAAAIAFLLLFRDVCRMLKRTRARRPDLTREQFIKALAREVRPETAEFLWDRMTFLLPTVAPHPEDHLWRDLPIDESEPMQEWRNDFARMNGANLHLWPAWPAGSPHTVRNYARWLEAGVVRAR